ncbi:TldD/PmbA family protein [bacterium]|nr:TldD/PmbA family protein [bacterium]
MDQKITGAARMTLDKCLKKGASSGEVFVIESKNLHIEVEKGDLDVIKDSTDRLMAVRVIVGRSLGFAFCTDFSRSSIDTLVDQVLKSAENTDEDPHNILPLPRESSFSSTRDKILLSVDLKEKIRLCTEMEKAAYKMDPRIKAARQVSYSDNISDVYLISSHGVEVSFGNASCSTFAMVIAQEGMESQMSWDMDVRTSYKQLKWIEVAQEAAQKALGLLGARPVSTRKAAVILSPPASISIFGSFAPAFYADSVQKGRSLMANRLGEIVASGEFNLTDDGLLAEGLATAPYDGEGVPMQKTKVIEDGRLNAYLYDTYTAHKDAVASTGNGVRLGFKSQPQVGATNMYIEKGELSEAELLSSVKEGLYVMEIMGAHTINPISGDFSLGASGHWIENGSRIHPVRGVTISGNMLDLFKNITGCADNLRFYGHFGSPSVFVSEMVISGGS